MNKEEQIKHIANVLWHYPNPCEFNNYNLVEELVREAFDNILSTNVVEVVYCKDCTKRMKNGFCLEHVRNEKYDYNYCSYGKRRE